MSRHNGAGALLQQAFRQFIWETLNRHCSNGKDDLALIGSRRSGSTLLMQIVAHHPGMKYSDQPFSIFTATSQQLKRLGHPCGGMFILPTRVEQERLRVYTEDMRAGRLHVQEPWRFWRRDFHFHSDRLVLKTTSAHYLLPVLAELDFKIVLYFRHPVPQSLSCARNNWGDKLAYFARHRPFVETLLNVEQRDLLDRLSQDGPELDRYVLGWCLENMPLFAAHAAGVPTVFYEDLVMMPDAVLDALSQTCAITPTPAMRKMVSEASTSVRGLSDKVTAAAIRSGDKQVLVGRWRERIDPDIFVRVQAILDLFPGCVYQADDVLPLRVKQRAD